MGDSGEAGSVAAPATGDENASTTRAAMAAGLAWLLPGAGHAFLGRWRRACAFFVVVGGFFALGLLLGGRLYTPIQGQPLSYLATFGDVGLGPAYLLLAGLGHIDGDPLRVTYEHGTTFLLAAGIMNLLLMLDAWDIGTGRKA